MYIFLHHEHNFFMIKACLFIFIIAIFSAIILLITKNHNAKQDNIISHKSLDKYFLQGNKKRKSQHNYSEKAHYNSVLHNFNANNAKNNIKYIKLKPCYISFETQKFEMQKLTYVEQNNLAFSKHIQNISPKIENKINNCKQTFRSVGNQCLIETVATSFANATLVEDRFDMFSAFKNFSNVVKVYKKEAEILSFLIIKNLISIYVILQKEIYKIKKGVLLAKHTKHLSKKSTSAKIYGTYMFNKSASKLLIKSGADIISATNNILDELDTIEYKQKIIYRYIRLLEKTI